MEEWKDIEGYKGIYQVSNKGNVKSLNYNRTGNEKILATKDHHGYRRVTLYKDKKLKTYFVHILVAKAFIINLDPLKFTQINHIDENRSNNEVSNLEWCDPKYNCNFGNRNNNLSKIIKDPLIQEKIQKTRKNKKCSTKARKVKCITTGKEFNSLSEASLFYNCDLKHYMKDIKSGKRKYCGTLKDGTPLEWKYLD